MRYVLTLECGLTDQDYYTLGAKNIKNLSSDGVHSYSFDSSRCIDWPTIQRWIPRLRDKWGMINTIPYFERYR
jgi:hypothetical protein